MSRSGTLGWRLAGVWKRLMGRRLVGRDHLGNEYFEFFERDLEGQQKQKREVMFNGGLDDWDPDKIPVEWTTWLNGNRAAPPTTDELSMIYAKRHLMQERVAQVEAEEEKARLRRATFAAREGEEPDVNQFIAQLSGKGFGADGGQKAKPPPSGEAGEGEGTGSGDTFKAGSWRPGQ